MELLHTNLLRVASFASEVYVADTEYRDPVDLWKKFKFMGVKVGPEWILSNKRIISFQKLEDPPFSSICDLGTCESFDSAEWAYTDDEDKKREFVRLLNFCLQERTRLLGLRRYENGKRRYFYFPATKNLKTRKAKYKSIKHETSREVFKQYGKKSDPTQRAYCRHSAFKGQFLQLDDEWYLEITPHYHFTLDGYREDPFRAGRLKGIKQLERNPAVLGHLLFWADFLQKPIASLFNQEYPYLDFDGLATVDIAIGLPDEVWYAGEEDEEAEYMKAADNQPSLFGL